MPLTPIDVQQKTFATALRGYDLDEVDDFLDSVVVALKDYDQRLSDAQERISTLEAELNDRGDAEGAIARALVAAQRSADAIVADAKEEAERVLSDADSEASQLADTRETERARLQAEIDEIRAKVGSVRASVADLAATIPVTLDEIDDVLESHAAKPTGATFDAAEPVGGYEIASEPEVVEDVEEIEAIEEIEEVERIDLSSEEEPHGQHLAPSPEGELDDAVDIRSEEDAGEGDRMNFDEVTVEPERSGDLPSIEELSDRIDSAFDDIVAGADETGEGSHRPWEDD